MRAPTSWRVLYLPCVFLRFTFPLQAPELGVLCRPALHRRDLAFKPAVLNFAYTVPRAVAPSTPWTRILFVVVDLVALRS